MSTGQVLGLALAKVWAAELGSAEQVSASAGAVSVSRSLVWRQALVGLLAQRRCLQQVV